MNDYINTPICNSHYIYYMKYSIKCPTISVNISGNLGVFRVNFESSCGVSLRLLPGLHLEVDIGSVGRVGHFPRVQLHCLIEDSEFSQSSYHIIYRIVSQAQDCQV